MRIAFCFVFVLVLEVLCSSTLHAQQTNTLSGDVKKQTAPPPSVEVVAIENRIKVFNVPAGSRLEIYSVVGIKVADIEMKQPDGEYAVNIAKGYYIIRIGETVRKVAIR
jgi:hypothetical protein